MGLFDFFRKTSPGDNRPTIRAVNIDGVLVNYDLSFEVYYKFYELNPFVFSVVNRRSNDVFAKGFELTKGAKKTYNQDFEKLLETSTTKTSQEFLKKLVRDYDITGNCYVYIVRSETGKAVGLQTLDPRYITPVSDKYGTLLGYIQNLNGIKVLSKADVFHLKSDCDLKNEIIGKSRMSSLFIDLESDQEARDSNLAFFKNNQTPSSLILMDKDYEIEAEDFTQVSNKIKQMFQGGKFQGGKNKHRSLLAQGVSGVVKVQDKINDMEFMELRKFTLEVTCSVYETPKALLGFTDSVNYSNGNTQYDTYWDNMESLGDVFAEFLTQVLQVFDTSYRFKTLKDNLRKLSQKSTIAKTLYTDSGVITLNEAREILQYEKVSDGDVFYKKETSKNDLEAKKTEEK